MSDNKKRAKMCSLTNNYNERKYIPYIDRENMAWINHVSKRQLMAGGNRLGGIHHSLLPFNYLILYFVTECGELFIQNQIPCIYQDPFN